jgi:GT2 family glycosyltransferase
MDTVSIVILSHNSREHLEVCLDSVFALDYQQAKIQVIAVDNASSDGTVAWLTERYRDVHCEACSENLGFARGINRGAAIASGKYLAFLNPDVRVDAHWLTALVETIQGDSETACAGSIVLNWTGEKIDYAGRPRDGLHLYPVEQREATAVLGSTQDVPFLFASGGAMLIPQAVFRQVDGFDPAYFLYHEDVDLGWRLWSLGHRVVRSARSLVYHRQGSAAARTPPETVARWVQKHTLYTVLKNLEEPHFQEVFPRLAYRLLARIRLGDLWCSAFPAALRDCMREADALWAKRAALQQKRVRSDAAIFAECGHPFHALLHDPDSAAFQRHWEEREIPGPFTDARTLHQYLMSIGFHAYEYNTELLAAELAAQQQRTKALVAQVGERQNAVVLLGAELAAQTAKVDSLVGQVAERQHAVESLEMKLASPGSRRAVPAEPSSTTSRSALGKGSVLFRRSLKGALIRLGWRRAAAGDAPPRPQAAPLMAAEPATVAATRPSPVGRSETDVAMARKTDGGEPRNAGPTS